MCPCPREGYLGSAREVGTAQKSTRWTVSAELTGVRQPGVYYDRNFSFFCCLSHSVGDLEWENGKGALLFRVSLKVK